MEANKHNSDKQAAPVPPFQQVGIVGAGTMGADIARLAAISGHPVMIFDSNPSAPGSALQRITKAVNEQVQKGKIARQQADSALSNIKIASSLEQFGNAVLVIEAIVENLDAKRELFRLMEKYISGNCILATNTSSISVTAIAAGCTSPARVLGMHFFNPAYIMPLVEIVPAPVTSPKIVQAARQLIDAWGKTTVEVKDTPGFIVNRIARPFYGEAIRIYEEGIADFSTIDWAMREMGGFKMGPFELMDFIGNDVNFKVTETVWTQFFFEPRYKPSLTQKQLYEAGFWGRKKGRGYYEYHEGAVKPEPVKDENLAKEIFLRIIAMLINEAYDALYYRIASREDIELAMKKGVNYPKGLLQWSEELGVATVLGKLEELQTIYGEDRYRSSPLLRRAAAGRGKN